MTAFRYRALDVAARETSGVIEADTRRSASTLLRERGLYPIDVAGIDHDLTNKRRRHQRKLRQADLSLLTRQWATLLASGLTVEQALSALTDQAGSQSLRHLLAGIRSEILAGYSLRAALDRYPQAFTPLYRASVAAGEKSGQLARVMGQLADYLDRSYALRTRTLQALLYPAIVVGVALAVIVVLMTYVVPQVVSVFHHSKQALPLLTRALILSSRVLRDWGWLFALVVAGTLLVGRSALRRPPLKRRWDAALLRTPLLGHHLRTLDATRFASTLSILVGSGVPLLAALEAGRQVISRLPLADAVGVASEHVREGQSLSRSLGASGTFPPFLIHMIANGEATGRIDELLDRAAHLQESELENRTAALTTLLEPMLLLLMGSFVLLIVLAVMQPIIEINTLMR